MFPAPKAATWLLCMHTAKTKSSTRSILIFAFVLDMVDVVARAERTAAVKSPLTCEALPKTE